jgi:hypothetical protein
MLLGDGATPNGPICLDPARRNENDYNYGRQSQKAAWPITPLPAVWPAWYCSNQQQNHDDNQHCVHFVPLLGYVPNPLNGWRGISKTYGFSTEPSVFAAPEDTGYPAPQWGGGEGGGLNRSGAFIRPTRRPL